MSVCRDPSESVGPRVKTYLRKFQMKLMSAYIVLFS
jgi:hypothetical protein